MKHSVGRFVSSERLLRQMLVTLSQTLQFGEARVERHGGVGGVLRQVEVGGASKLLFNDERLLEKLEASSQELVLHLQVVVLAQLGAERFVDDRETRITLDILPTPVTTLDDAC